VVRFFLAIKAGLGFNHHMQNEQKKNGKKQMVKILGQMVREGTKKHAILVQQFRHFNDLSQSEQGQPK